MALTQIRGEQIQNQSIKNVHVANDAGIAYTKLDLAESLVATDLNLDESVEQRVLNSKKIALWNMVQSVSVTGNSVNVTAEVQSAAQVDDSTNDTSNLGVLTTGTGPNGEGVENYKVQIRDSATAEPVLDPQGGKAYAELAAELTQDGDVYSLTFYYENGEEELAMGLQHQISITFPNNDQEDSSGGSYQDGYVIFRDPSFEEYQVRYTVDGAAYAGATSWDDFVTVDIESDDTGATIAQKTSDAIAADATLSAVLSSTVAAGTMTVTFEKAGPIEDPFVNRLNLQYDVSHETVRRGTPGEIDFLFAEVYTYQTAPARSFITGLGFADIVGISGTHNHNDLYYTRYELESGVLDDRYYSRNALNNGQLDGRYYTETELDPEAGTGANVLDGRYFTEEELGSNSGASLIGVDSISNLDAGNVQAALAEIQGDIDGITSGNININHSLDDAYHDGSTIVVDGANQDSVADPALDALDFQIADDKMVKFTSDDGTVDVLSVSPSASGDTVAVTGSFNVTGATTLDGTTIEGTLTQTSGAVDFTTGAAFNVDATNVTVDGTAASSFATTDANLTVETKGASGDLIVRSVGNVNLKDSNLTAPVPLSQEGTAALTGFDTATSIVGALNENAADLSAYINLLTQTADSNSGADQIGVTGITGILPEGGTVGADATLQAMLEGIAKSAGGVKTFADEAAFVASKTDGDYLPVDTMVYFKANDRFAIVLEEGTTATEGTHWDYLWGANQPFAGADFTITSDALTVNSTGSVDVDAADVAVDAGGAHVGLTATGQLDLDSADGQLVQLTSDTEVEVNGGDLVDINGTAVEIDGAVTVTGASDDNFTVNTSGNGNVVLNSEGEIDLNAPASFFRGDVSIDSGFQMNVDKINITSVDPSDSATITGQRTGVPFSGNLLTNPGFEDGSGNDAENWTEGSFSGRTQAEKYYDNWSYQYSNSFEPGDENAIATQAVTGLNVTTHIASVWFKGQAQSSIEIVVNDGTPAVLVPAGTTHANWTRYNADVTPGDADGNVVLQVNGTMGQSNNFFLDAVQLEEGTGTPTDFFSSMQSELILRIGDNVEDKISFQSLAPEGGTVESLMEINNTTVRIFGDLVVDGQQTIVNSNEVDIGDERITLLANQEDASAGTNALFEVNRGTDGNVALRWNETSDEWELTNDGVNYGSIVTTSGGTALSLDTAYDGGSSVTVDDTNVEFALATDKQFIVSGPTDASKLVVKGNTGADAIAVQTEGGVDIDTGSGFTLNDDSGSSFTLTDAGSVSLTAAAGQAVTLTSDSSVVVNGGALVNLVGTTLDLDGDLDLDGESADIDTTGAISLDAAASSNFTTSTGNLTFEATAGSLALVSGSNVTFNDANQTSALPFSQSNVDGLSTRFAHTTQTQFNWTVRNVDSPASLLAAVNTNRDDLYEYVELLNTQGAAIGVAAGANLIGVDGITGVTPAGKTEGDASNLQEMLEGLAISGGGGKTFADEAAFTSAKSDGTYFKANEHVWILDSNRMVRVVTQGTDVAEGTDWVYVADTSANIGGGSYQFNLADTTADSFKVATTGGVDIDTEEGFNLADDSGSSVAVAASGAVTVTSANTVDVTGSDLTFSGTGTTTLAGDTAVSINGATTITGATNDNVVATTSGSGQVQLVSASEVDITGGAVDINGGDGQDVTIDTAGTGKLVFTSTNAVQIQGAAASYLRTIAGNLALGSAAELTFADSRQSTPMPLTDSGHTTLPGATAPASIYEAINNAYENTGDTSRKSYDEVNVNTTDVTNDYVVLSNSNIVGDLDEATGTASDLTKSPSALRNDGMFFAVYLNGLRLSDSEWNYEYIQASDEHRVTFNGASNITLVDGDLITVDGTFNKTSNA